ncbi:MAG TPA: FAD binding domain-containing protein [Flavisolibacter sp.]
MIHFILNETEIAATLPPATTLLDFIRYHQHLTGTKIGCREGDCGACTVLTGSLRDGHLHYSSATSCLMPLANAQGKHIVTIEGLNMPGGALNPIQQAMADEGATQCGFCTPGFVVSLAGFCLSDHDAFSIPAAIDGNICRCTGYKSIERAAHKISLMLVGKNEKEAIEFVTSHKIVPPYFRHIRERLVNLPAATPASPAEKNIVIAGGTDVYVQKHEEIKNMHPHFIPDRPESRRIESDGSVCVLGPAVTVTDIRESRVMQDHFPHLNRFMKLVSSTPIRNMATVAGNFVNASPIGDLTIFFLALDGQLVLEGAQGERTVPLRKFYKGYKILDKAPDETIRSIQFVLPDKDTLFNFEKVSKRTHLDIASVNTALRLVMRDGTIAHADLSAGGVGPVPAYLANASAFLQGKKISASLIRELCNLLPGEISPISDARGSAAYKRLLLTQLVKAHFLELFPGLKAEELVTLTKPA